MPYPSSKDFSQIKEALTHEDKIVEVLNIDEKEIERELEEMKKAAAMKNELGQKNRQPMQDSYDPMEEVPTLAIHSPVMEKVKSVSVQEKSETAS